MLMGLTPLCARPTDRLRRGLGPFFPPKRRTKPTNTTGAIDSRPLSDTNSRRPFIRGDRCRKFIVHPPNAISLQGGEVFAPSASRRHAGSGVRSYCVHARRLIRPTGQSLPAAMCSISFFKSTRRDAYTPVCRARAADYTPGHAGTSRRFSKQTTFESTHKSSASSYTRGRSVRRGRGLFENENEKYSKHQKNIQSSRWTRGPGSGKCLRDRQGEASGSN